MLRIRFIVIILSILVKGVFAQNNDLNQAWDSVFSNPSFSEKIVDSFIAKKNNDETSDLYEVYRLKGIVNVLQGNLEVAESSFLKATEYAIPDTFKVIQNQLDLGRCVGEKGDKKTQLKYLQQAFMWNNGKFNKNTVRIYSLLSTYYASINLFDEAIKNSEKAIETQQQYFPEDTLELNVEKQKLANRQFSLYQYDLAIKNFRDVLPYFLMKNDLQKSFATLSSMSGTFLGLNKIDSAIAYGKKSLIMAHRLNNFGYAQLSNSILARAYSANRNTSQALIHIEKSLERLNESFLFERYEGALDFYIQQNMFIEAEQLISNVEKLEGNKFVKEHLSILHHKTKLYAKTNKFNKAFEVASEIISIKDSLYQNEIDLRLAEATTKLKLDYTILENQKTIQENHLLEEKYKAQSFKTWGLVVLSTALVAILILVYLTFSINGKKNKLKSKNLLLEQEKIRNDLLQKNEALEKKQSELKILAIRENKILSELEGIETKITSKRYADAINSINKIKQNSGYFQNKLIDSDLIHTDDISELRKAFPNLTEGELTYCAMYKANLSNKEIATILNIDPKSASMRKYRIVKKLGLKNNSSLLNELSLVS